MTRAVRKSLQWFLVVLSLVWLLHHPAAGQAQAPRVQPELRGVWLTNIDSDVLFERDRLSRAIEQLAQHHFNTLYPTVWNGGYTFYPSSVNRRVTGQTIDPNVRGRDPLAEVVRQGHRQNLAVIPWFEFGLMAPADSELAHRHPAWLARRQDGSTVWMEGKEPRVWLNPYHPAVQTLILDLVREIVGRYDVDGMQFDDHFGMPADFGYDPLTVTLYQRTHSGRRPPTNYQDAEWTRWRADQLTGLMTRVFQTVKARNPKALLALSPNPQPFSYANFLADWQTWERRGLVEELTIQIYRNDLAQFTAELNRPEVQAARQHIPVSIGILTGLKQRAVSSSQIQAQIQAVRAGQFAGFSCFFYETLWNQTGDSPEQRRAFWRSLLPTSVPRPRLIQPA